MTKIYIEGELPKRCDDCPFYKLDTYVDVFGSVINSHECVLDGSILTGNCPLKSLSDRLKEERKKVLWEIRKRAKRTQIYIKPTEKSPTGKEKCFVYEVSDDFLDQIERGE